MLKCLENETFSKRGRNLRGSIFAELMHLVPELYQAVFFDIECKLQKSVILWTFFI